MDNLINKIFNKYFKNSKFTCCLNDIFEILNLIHSLVDVTMKLLKEYARILIQIKNEGNKR